MLSINTRNANFRLDQTGKAGIAATQVQTVSLINLTKGRSNPAHGEKEQADDRHLEHTEMKNPPIDNGTQKE